jgi:cytochrome c biogenesis protein CcmG/thiol:disulfide interchange protein DsbE
MLRRFALVVLVAAWFGGAYAAPSYPALVKKQLYAQTDLRGKKAPALSAQKWLDGKQPNTKGKIVLVDFWATWCPPCRETIPELVDWQKKFAKDIVVVGISGETEAKVRAFAKQMQVPYALAVDSQEKMSHLVGVAGIPHILIITPDGIVRWQGFPLSGEEPLTESTIKRIVDAWRAGKR